MTVVEKIGADRSRDLWDLVLERLGAAPGDSLELGFDEPGQVVIRRTLMPMTLEEMLSRRIDEPYDDAKIREEWQEEAAQELPRQVREHGGERASFGLSTKPA